jgi:hypothetical protein
VAPPVIVAPAPERTIEEVFALKVKFVLVEKFTAWLVELSVTVEDPKVIVRIFELLEDKTEAVIL